VERVDGCFFNVVGLPLERVRALLRGEDGGEAP
jgi:predicted house-cleaning NTP pyrophosphatase (Maf/HAM1 superfamily)